MLVLKDVLTDMAKAIVETPDGVSVTETEDENGEILLTLTVAPDDMGKVIGRHGRIANALRSIMKAAAATVGKKVTVEIQ
ncbi:MAG: KH domain-containing protein [Clostridia bacterium]|nr:KH domain-containing protein [Clostridia bacterium]